MRWVGGVGHQGLTGLDLDSGVQTSYFALLPRSGLSFMAGHIPGLHMQGSPGCVSRSVLV